MMNVVITGASGLLGRAVVTEFKKNEWKVLGLAHTRVRYDLLQIDVTNIAAVSSIVKECKPHAIIHCAAEKSPEIIQTNPEAYHFLNVKVPIHLAKLAAEVNTVFVFISCDYVFSGENPPYAENAVPDPVNAYGSFKYDAEKMVLNINPGSCILRIPVIYGGEEYVEESTISCLINTVQSSIPAFVSNYEIRYPSHTSDIATIIYQLVQIKLQDPSENGIFHWCGSEPLTLFQMARVMAETFGLSPEHLIPFNEQNPIVLSPRNAQLKCERLQNLGIRRHTSFVDGVQELKKFL